MRIILCGYGGHMGREVRTCAERDEHSEIVAGVDPMIPAEGICVSSFAECEAEADVIIDFSHHSMTGALLDFAEAKNLPVVLATTGQTDEEKARIRQAAGKIPVFPAANYSLGIATLTDLVKRAAALYPDGEIEIVEQHHDRKLDAPSGTALALFSAVTYGLSTASEKRSSPSPSGSVASMIPIRVSAGGFSLTLNSVLVISGTSGTSFNVIVIVVLVVSSGYFVLFLSDKAISNSNVRTFSFS